MKLICTQDQCGIVKGKITNLQTTQVRMTLLSKQNRGSNNLRNRKKFSCSRVALVVLSAVLNKGSLITSSTEGLWLKCGRFALAASHWSSHSHLNFRLSASANYWSNARISKTALSFIVNLYDFDRTGDVVIASLIASYICFIAKNTNWC